MARATGLLNFSANFEVGYAQPFDARAVVPLKSDLLLADTWDGFSYVGMLVAVTADPTPENNAVYLLKAADFTLEANWEKVGTGAETTPPEHNATTSIQGGTTDEYYHLTAAELGVVQATSGTNTGDETLESVGALLDGAGPKATNLADNDRLPILDSEDLNTVKTVTFAELKTQVMPDMAGVETKQIIESADSTVIVATTSARAFVASTYAGEDPRYVVLSDGFLGQEIIVADSAYNAGNNPINISGTLSGDVVLTAFGQAVTFVWIGTRWTALSFGANIPPSNALTDESDVVLEDLWGNTLTT